MKKNNVALRRFFIYRRRSLSILLVASTVLGYPASVIASPESFEALRQGTTQLAEGRYEAALQKFEEAAQLDPADAEAPFFQGVALNRLGQYERALERLTKAGEMSNPHPDQAFETGWALVGLKKWDEAIVPLEQFENSSAGRGQTQEFLGRAYLGSGQFARAERAFDRALQRDPRLTSTVRFYQAILAQRRSDPEAARENLRDLMQDAPDSALSTLLRGRMTGAGTRPEKPWNAAISLGAGHNSNALFLGDGIPVPAGSGRKGADFARFSLDGDYTWRFKNGNSATAGYGFDGNFYKDLSDVNEAAHYLFADYRHRFAGKLAGSIRISDEYTLVSNNKFRNSVALRPALTFIHSDRASTELAYSYASSNYYFPTTPVQNRDGDSHTLVLSHTTNLSGSRLRASGGLYHTRNQAEGSDYDYDSTGVFVSLRHPLPGKITGDLTYSHSWDRYDQTNSLSTPAFSQKRRDDVDVISLQLTRPLTRRDNYAMDIYTRYDYRRDDSNINFFKYHQHVFTAGVRVAF